MFSRSQDVFSLTFVSMIAKRLRALGLLPSAPLRRTEPRRRSAFRGEEEAASKDEGSVNEAASSLKEASCKEDAYFLEEGLSK